MSVSAAMRVALVTDWLTTPGGAEKVLLELHRMCPDAPIYTSQYRPRKITWFHDADVRTGWLNFLPASLRKIFGPLRQQYFSHLDLSEYDLVISVTGAEAKSVRTQGAYHICYCHAPTQYYWGKYDEYIRDPGFGFLNPLVRFFFKLLVKPLRRADLEAAALPNQFVTISEHSAAEIKHYYHRDATIIAPPVDIEKFSTGFSTAKGKKSTNTPQKSTTNAEFSTSFPQLNTNFTQVFHNLTSGKLNRPYIIACRQVSWKRVDLAIAACKSLNRPLLVVGDGPEHQALQKLAAGSDNIYFLPWLSSADLATCLRHSRAFLFPSLEPFGIAPVEALAAGCPVIAYHKGGSLDFITEGKNGLFFNQQTPASLARAIKTFEQSKLPPRRSIAATAKAFSADAFRRKITILVATSLRLKSHPAASPTLPATGPSTPAISSPALSSHPSAVSPAPKKPFLYRLFRSLLIALPAVLFFSYYPVIPLGSNSTMNFELSLPLLWLVGFDFTALLALVVMNRIAKPTKGWGIDHRGISDRRIFLLSLLPFYATISIFWSANPLRATLTAGIIWLLFFAIFAIVYLAPLICDLKSLIRPLLRVFFATTTFVCCFCILQALADTFGTPTSSTLLCTGCTYRSFGFPHPSGFAIEPQFMGNLLLAPTLLAFYLISFKRQSLERLEKRLLLICTVLYTFTLFFTFSRGAIYSFAVAFIIFIIFAFKKHYFRPTLLIIPIAAFLGSLTCQGTLAALGPTSETFPSAVAKSLHQLSLGLIDFRAQPAASRYVPIPITSGDFAISIPDADTRSELMSSQPATPTIPSISTDTSFDGYVAESTNTRLELSGAALRTWLSSPQIFLLGAGLGGAGTAMSQAFPAVVPTAKEIVQNQPISLLLELGLLGALLIILEILIVFFPQIFPAHFLDGRAAPSEATGHGLSASFWSHPALPLLAPLITSYIISTQFFAGLPNALHIYLLPPLFYVIFNSSPRRAKTRPKKS